MFPTCNHALCPIGECDYSSPVDRRQPIARVTGHYSDLVQWLLNETEHYARQIQPTTALAAGIRARNEVSLVQLLKRV